MLCEKLILPYVLLYPTALLSQSKTNTSLRHADSVSKPGQMMNTMTGIITMSSSNRWMTKIGVGRSRQQCPVVEHI